MEPVPMESAIPEGPQCKDLVFMHEAHYHETSPTLKLSAAGFSVLFLYGSSEEVDLEITMNRE